MFDNLLPFDNSFFFFQFYTFEEAFFFFLFIQILSGESNFFIQKEQFEFFIPF